MQSTPKRVLFLCKKTSLLHMSEKSCTVAADLACSFWHMKRNKPGSIATKTREPGDFSSSSRKWRLPTLPQYTAVQYHRRCCLSLLPSPLSAPLSPASARSASLRSLSRARALSRAPQARTAHTPHGSLRALRALSLSAPSARRRRAHRRPPRATPMR